MRVKYLVAVVGVLALAVAGTGIAVGKGGRGDHHTFNMTFSGTSKQKRAAGVKIRQDRFDYKAPAAGQPANPVTGITWTLPPGTKIDTSIFSQRRLANCSRSRLGTNGDPRAANCPEIGKGDAVAITGFGAGVDPVGENVTAYAGPNLIIGRLTPKGAVGQTANVYIRVVGRKLVVSVPRFCLPGDNVATPACDGGEAVLTGISANITKRVVGRKTLIRSGNCKTRRGRRTGKWTMSAAYRYRSGPGERVKSTQRCRK